MAQHYVANSAQYSSTDAWTCWAFLDFENF